MTQQFLDLYKQLEQKLVDKYENTQRHYSSAIMEFIHSPEGEPFKDKLDLCREVRNLLSHHALVEGEPLVSPSTVLIQTLKDALLYLDQPPLVIDVATPTSKIMKASLNDYAFEVMKKMKMHGYSHIPVIENQRFYGVFSHTTPFYYALQSDIPLNERTKLSHLKELLPIEAHDNERYVFISKNTTLARAQEIFTLTKKNNRRTVVLFISEDGTKNTKVLAMVTPLDVLTHKDND